ncbi:MAG: suppressor of fused domain protein [Hamadaea sp.]|uniref:suppressor of fused domain protein n=1 Tax=Hamadaea sp. TaxID=2024425 RepID=UPI0017C859DD|nr:suppressor of fused domain protein [Hamadaea sp.]NUT21774.1 suppressor of fused domain protein [Hamadaea sp.]
MSPPVILREVFHAYRTARGVEDDGYVFDDDGAVLGRLDVLVFRPADERGLTSFATIGMAARELPAEPGPGGGGRAELQFSRRGRLDREDEYAVAVALANLAAHPFVTGQQLNWGHQIGLGTEFPTFPGCGAVFLSGPLTNVEDGYIRTTEGAVRLVTVVPITEAERSLGRTLGPIAFAQRLLDEVDVYAERPA